MIKTKKAFTLVELIVVIVILAVLWTISFISFQDYSRDSRNSVRISDLWVIETSLWIFEVNTWKFPTPSSFTWVTYSGSLLWMQWTFWEEPLRNLDNISKLPVDPFYQNEYSYSVSWRKNSFQLWWLLEWGFFSDNWIVNSTYAAWNWNDRSYVVWNHTLKDISALNTSNCPLLTIPSLFISNLPSDWILQKDWEYSFIYHESENLLKTYINKIDSTIISDVFKIKETYNSCSMDNIDQLNLYIAKTSVAYQQVVWDNLFRETIYNFNSTSYKRGTLDDLKSNRINVSAELIDAIMNPALWNIYKDLFTSVDNTEIVSSYYTDSLWTWNKSGTVNNSSYVINWNQLTKTDATVWVIYPDPTLPITSTDTSIIFDIIDFNWGSIFIYDSYTDSDNYHWFELTSAWYTIVNNVWWNSNIAPYPVTRLDPIFNNSTIEIIISWDNVELLINDIQKENNVEATANFWLIPALELNNGWIIDNFNLIYR